MNAKAESLMPELAAMGDALRLFDKQTKPFNAPDTESETARMRALNDIEREPTLEECKEVALCDMTQEELAVVVLHDPDLATRRAALRLYKLDVLHEVEMKHLRVMSEIRKAVKS